MKSLLLKVSAVFILFFLLSTQATQSQALGSWQSYMAYQDASMVAMAHNGFVYAIYKSYPHNHVVPSDFNTPFAPVFDGSLMRYDPNNGEKKKIFKANGLNDAHIARIAYMESQKMLVIIYSNGNIDLYDTNTDNGSTQADIYNLPYLKDNTNMSDKTVNDIVFVDSFFGSPYAFICMNYGIQAVDMKTKTFKNTYSTGKTNSMCIWGDYIYAATDKGVIRARTGGFLTAASSWESYLLSYGGDETLITKLLVQNNRLVFYQDKVGVFYQTEPDTTPIVLQNAPTSLNQITILNNQLVLLDNSGIYFYLNLDSSYEKKINSSSSVHISSINNSDTYWLAQGYNGISNIAKSTMTQGPQITINSPKRNLVYSMNFNQGKLLVVGGGMNLNNFNNAGTLMIMDDGNWYNLDELETQQKMRQQTGIPQHLTCRDFSDIAVNPKDKNHYFVSAFGEGLYEFRTDPDTKKINFEWLYTEQNTSKMLKSVLNTNIHQFIRLGGLAYDAQNNLYIASSYELDVDTPIVIYTADAVKKWENLFPPLLPKLPLFRHLIVTTKDQKWVAGPRPGDRAGVYVFNDDDKNNIIARFARRFTDQDGESLSSLTFNSITEDLNGTVWVGTSIGPITFPSPENITKPGAPDSSFENCIRIKVPKYDGTDDADFLLDKINVSCIAVDGANRKWIGTSGSGVFLVSPTGEEVIANFTMGNSPLISDNIIKIAINNANGEVFIGTDKGLISYMSDASGGNADYSNVYAYPNPVRPDFEGNVVVTGLIKDSNVRITDLSGNTMYQGTSLGGQFTWNCKNRAGERVMTGVYLVFAAVADGSQGVVSKIVVIK